MDLQIPGYQIIRPIAEGGMASVYLAIQESLQRQVDLNLLRRFDDPVNASRCRNEGRIIASLNHRNIITIHDIGVIGERHYLAMEYLALFLPGIAGPHDHESTGCAISNCWRNCHGH